MVCNLLVAIMRADSFLPGSVTNGPPNAASPYIACIQVNHSVVLFVIQRCPDFPFGAADNDFQSGCYALRIDQEIN
jgi:hypothetical protein